MSQIKLNQFFVNNQPALAEQPVAELSITIPTGKIFDQLPDHPAPKLRDLRERAEKLQVLQSRLEDATIHQKRDRVIACVAGAIMAGLVAGIVLGALLCPPVATASAITLLVLGFASSFVVQCAAEEDRRNGYEMIKYADLFCVGIPRLMSHFLTRKSALQNKVNQLKIEVSKDLMVAGLYLREHLPAIIDKLEGDIENTEVGLALVKQLGQRSCINALEKDLADNRALLKEIIDNGQTMVVRMQQAGLFPDD